MFGNAPQVVRFIARVFITISLRASNFPSDVRHQLVNLASLQTFKSPFPSVCVDVEVVVYTSRPVSMVSYQIRITEKIQ